MKIRITRNQIKNNKKIELKMDFSSFSEQKMREISKLIVSINKHIE